MGLNGCGHFKGSKKPNIILVTLDTTRADHLSCYGYHRTTTPNIDRIAKNSVLYLNAISPSSWTLPAHASLFTGKFPSSHGAMYDPDGPVHLADGIQLSAGKANLLKKFRARGISENEQTLAEILKHQGYETGAVVSGPWMKKIFGLGKGFNYYDDNEISTLNGKLARQVTQSALDWIETLDKKKFFLFLNYFDPHIPYMAPEGYMEHYLPPNIDFSHRNPTDEELIALYDAEILYMDHYFGKLVNQLKKLKIYENSLIIITADHGELFGEHGKYRHGKTLYQEEIHIPLIIKWPGNEIQPSEAHERIQLNDIFAIILDHLGLPIPGGTQAGPPPQIAHPVISETYPLEEISNEGHYSALFNDNYKFIWNSKGNHLLFNIKEDPKEEKNLADLLINIKNQQAAYLKSYLKTLPKPGKIHSRIQLDENTKHALKSLGYLK